MIWCIISIALYLIIASASLMLICAGEETNDVYYDVRNIITALLWPLVFMGSALVWLIKRIAPEKKEVKDAK